MEHGIFSDLNSSSGIQLPMFESNNHADENLVLDDYIIESDEEDPELFSPPGRSTINKLMNVVASGEGGDEGALYTLLMLLKSSKDNDKKRGEQIWDINPIAESNTIRIESKPKLKNYIINNTSNLNSKHFFASQFNVNELRQYFHLPIIEVARQLNVCPTLFKKICRKNNICRWPYRQIRSITKSLQSVEIASTNPAIPAKDRERYKKQIARLHHYLDLIMQDPNYTVTKEMFLRDTLIDSSGDTGYEQDSALPALKYDISAILAASIAAADFEMVHTPQTKKRKVDDENNTNQTKSKSRIDEELLVSSQLNFASSRVEFILLNDSNSSNEKSKVHFLAPVNLLPLERKAQKNGNRIVPLIEPDICNYMKMEILPSSVLPIKNVIPNSDLINQLSMQLNEYELQYKELQHEHLLPNDDIFQ